MKLEKFKDIFFKKYHEVVEHSRLLLKKYKDKINDRYQIVEHQDFSAYIEFLREIEPNQQLIFSRSFDNRLDFSSFLESLKQDVSFIKITHCKVRSF